jgi:hypothetical protein
MWRVAAVVITLGVFVYISNAFLKYPTFVYNMMFVLTFGPGILIYSIIVRLSSRDVKKNMCKLLQEINVIFVLILLGVLFYLDNIREGITSAEGILFPMGICGYISFEVIGGYFPMRLTQILMAVMVLMLCFNVFNNTFLKTSCLENMLEWGIFGEKISSCTVRRLINQTIISLLIPAMIATFTGNVNHMFFCRANVYRSTGTIECEAVNETYVESMQIEMNKNKERNNEEA